MTLKSHIEYMNEGTKGTLQIELNAQKTTRGCNLCAARMKAVHNGTSKEDTECMVCGTIYKSKRKKRGGK